MQKEIFTAGTLDNLDPNLSSTTAHGSFHGFRISIIQQPTNENSGIYRTQFEFEMVETNKKHLLPGSYVTVPAASMKAVNIGYQFSRPVEVFKQDNTFHGSHIMPQCNLSQLIHLSLYTSLAHKVSPPTDKPLHPHELYRVFWEDTLC